jgi:hypothetical protein
MSKKRKIIDKNGNLLVGKIENQEIDFNYKDYKLLNFFDKEVKGLKKRFKFHHFNYYAVLSDKYVFAFAIIDLGYVKSIFLYLYDYKGNFLFKTDKKMMGSSKKMNFPINPDKHEIKYKDKKLSLNVNKDYLQGLISVEIKMDFLDVRFSVKYNNSNNPLKVVTPAGHNGWTFTEKCSNINEFEYFSIKFESNELDFKSASLVYDWSGGYLKRETNWLWASFSGLNSNNKLIGANFAAMVNETYETENIYWIGKDAFKQDNIIFNYDKNNVYAPWIIENKNKTAFIEFLPQNEINDNTNMIFVKNSFRQFIGKFSGFFFNEKKEKIIFKNISGITEIHKALW